MCGRFAQVQTRADYLDYLASELEYADALDTVPIGRFNVAPGTHVLLINQRDTQLHMDPVRWGYGPDWWLEMKRQPVINARVETAAGSRMFQPLWDHGRMLVAADGWYEWKKSPDDPKKKQLYFIHSDGPIFFAAISRFHTQEAEQHDDGFVIVTAASDSGLLDIHDRRPVVLLAAAAREWLNPDTSSTRAEELATRGAIPADKFSWYPVSKAVGSTYNNSIKLIEKLN